MQSLIQLAEDLQDLHAKWQPLEWQKPFGRALFYENKKELGAQCGRSAGKTELISYCHWRWAKENPGSESYIIEPLFNQAREILWASNRIQSFGPENWIDSVNNTECRITFTNGSFIKLEGSDRPDKLRGIKPQGPITWDEVKDCRYESIQAMDPNRARYNVPVLYVGTPPSVHNHYVDIMERLKKDQDSFWCQASSYSNTYNSKEWLDKKKKQLIDSLDEETWLREYEAVFIKGGKNSIFANFSNKHKPNFSEIKPKDLNKWQIMVSFDPASTSVFGAVFILFNEWSKLSIVFDELYVTDQSLMTAKQVYLQVEEKLKPFKGKVRDIRFGYDEAAAWFRNEINEFSNWWLEPSSKSEFGVDGYINLVRQRLSNDLLIVCADCPKLVWEMENYQKDENGKIPKENDHNINALQYGLSCLGLRLDEDKPETIIDSDLQKRAYTPEDDMDFSSQMTEID